jgi:NAD(P)-dependent dehydrogenase (short-subunit alcohol dehydrogenase family)
MRFPDMFRLDGRVAVVTGGTGHLGVSMASVLAEAGATVVVASRDQARCARVSAEIAGANPAATVVPAALDIASRDSILRCFADAAGRFGGVDILVNNAVFGAANTIEEMTDDEWGRGIDGTLNSVFRCISTVVPVMRQRGGGTILNVASMYGFVSPDPRTYTVAPQFANPPSYGAAKAGVLQLTRYAACHLARYGIRVNAVSPGPFPSERVQRTEAFVRELAGRTALGRIGRPDELKGAVLFLCSGASSYVTGHNLVVDGGWTVW